MTQNNKIKKIQQLVGVTADGIIGPKTIDAILEKLTPESGESVGTGESGDAHEIRNRMAAKILNMEDYKITGPASLRVTRLPSGDGGGTWEIAGICDGIEPEVFNRIKSLLDKGLREEAWEECLSYILENTATIASYLPNYGFGYEFMVRDLAFNMGNAGAIKVIQGMANLHANFIIHRSPGAIKVIPDMSNRGGTDKLAVDGKWGIKTQTALLALTSTLPEDYVVNALDKAARARYQNIVDANPVKEKFLKGWLNRCDDRLAFANTLVSSK